MGRGFPGLLGAEKRGHETDKGDFDSLGAQYRGGQHAVQSPGKEAQGPYGFGHRDFR